MVRIWIAINFYDGGIVCDTEDPNIQQKMDSAVMKVAKLAWSKTVTSRQEPLDPYLTREHGGLICCDSNEKIKATNPHPGPPLKKENGHWRGAYFYLHLDYTNPKNPRSVYCSSEFGDDWTELGDYHTHPESRPMPNMPNPGEDFTPDDEHENANLITPLRNVKKWKNGKPVFVGKF